MTRLFCSVVVAVGIAACTAGAEQEQLPKGRNVNPDAGLIADFKQRVDAYVKLRAAAESTSPDLNQTKKPQEIVTAEKSMRSAHPRNPSLGQTR